AGVVDNDGCFVRTCVGNKVEKKNATENAAATSGSLLVPAHHDPDPSHRVAAQWCEAAGHDFVVRQLLYFARARRRIAGSLQAGDIDHFDGVAAEAGRRSRRGASGGQARREDCHRRAPPANPHPGIVLSYKEGHSGVAREPQQGAIWLLVERYGWLAKPLDIMTKLCHPGVE